MIKVHEIQKAIESLPNEDYIRLREWFTTRDWERWDKQVEEDSKAGKLDSLAEEAIAEKAKGNLREL